MIEHLNKDGLTELIADIKGYCLDKLQKVQASAEKAEEAATSVKDIIDKDVYLTQAEYDALVAAGTVDMTKDYNIYEEET